LAARKSDASDRVLPVSQDLLDDHAKHLDDRGLTAADGD
jgi:hypothetical protein